MSTDTPQFLQLTEAILKTLRGARYRDAEHALQLALSHIRGQDQVQGSDGVVPVRSHAKRRCLTSIDRRLSPDQRQWLDAEIRAKDLTQLELVERLASHGVAISRSSLSRYTQRLLAAERGES